MKNQIKKYFNKYVEFSDSEIDAFFSELTLIKLKKKEFLVREGQVCRSNFFVINGLIRSFYIDKKGNEKITHFAIQNWWITNMESFINETPSISSIQVLENTTVLEINKKKIRRTLHFDPKT